MHELPKFDLAEGSNIKHIISILSGKGGVGKTLVTSLLASELTKNGFKVGILDADITGPSIPNAFTMKEYASEAGENLINPCVTTEGIKFVSASLFLENNEQPIIWRAPMITGFLGQLYSEVNWGELDYLLIDMPPGTGDIALTIFQSIPVEGTLIVSSPQLLVSQIVAKTINMASQMNIPIIGLVENMAYVECKNCKEKNYIFGRSHAKEVCEKYNLKFLGSLPIREDIAELVDTGNINQVELNEFNETLETVINLSGGLK